LRDSVSSTSSHNYARDSYFGLDFGIDPFSTYLLHPHLPPSIAHDVATSGPTALFMDPFTPSDAISQTFPTEQFAGSLDLVDPALLESVLAALDQPPAAPQVSSVTLQPPPQSIQPSVRHTPYPKTKPASVPSTGQSPSSTKPNPLSASSSTKTSPPAGTASVAPTASSSSTDDLDDTTLRRQRNTIAARKYRQKRTDRISELEDALAAMTKDRDTLRLQLGRRDAEVGVLREMLAARPRG